MKILLYLIFGIAYSVILKTKNITALDWQFYVLYLLFPTYVWIWYLSQERWKEMNNFQVLIKLMECYANAEINVIVNGKILKIDKIDNSESCCAYITLRESEVNQNE